MDTLSIISNFEKLKIIVIGDIMLDRFITGNVSRISPEAPVPVLRVNDESFSIGGAGNVAMNLIKLGATVKMFGVIGDDYNGHKLSELLRQTRIDSDDLLFDPGRITTTKTRIISKNQQIVRIDHELNTPIPDLIRKRIVKALIDSVNKFKPDGIILSDYDKGMITKELCKETMRHPRLRNIFFAVDPKGRDFVKYRGASVITPNRSEAEDVCGFKIDTDAAAKRAIQHLNRLTGIGNIIITRGSKGISYRVKGGKTKTLQSHAREIFDVTGAGDTVVSVLTLSYLSSESWETSVRMANAAGGIVVGRVGTASVTPAELITALGNDSNLRPQKIVSRESLMNLLPMVRKGGKTIIFTNGCFDLFHKGHLYLLNQAKKLGDILIVAINDDESVRRIKGEGRPYIPASDRAEMIAELGCVDFVVIFPEDSPLELIKRIKPDTLVKGSDYKNKTVVGSEFIGSYGGKVRFVQQVKGVSTSRLSSKIKSLN